MQPCRIVVVTGPTASGKTALGVALCRRLNGEVVSGDSMQVYRQLSVATAKPTAAEMQGVPHHLIDCRDITESFSVADYVREADAAVAAIVARGRQPVVVGGTGLYIHALIDHVQFGDTPADPALRAALRERAEQEGGAVLLEELRAVDPQTAARLHPHDVGRIVRALEVARLSGRTLTDQREASRREPSPYVPFWIGLDYADRQTLYDRIDARVERMMADGLVEEARRLLQGQGAATAAQAIGCKELAPYLAGQMSLEEATAHIQRQTRRYAKRQLSWFRREQRMHWYHPEEYADADALARRILDDMRTERFWEEGVTP